MQTVYLNRSLCSGGYEQIVMGIMNGKWNVAWMKLFVGLWKTTANMVFDSILKTLIGFHYMLGEKTHFSSKPPKTVIVHIADVDCTALRHYIVALNLHSIEPTESNDSYFIERNRKGIQIHEKWIYIACAHITAQWDSAKAKGRTKTEDFERKKTIAKRSTRKEK